MGEILKDRIDAKLAEQAKKAAIVMYENDIPLSVIATVRGAKNGVL